MTCCEPCGIGRPLKSLGEPVGGGNAPDLPEPEPLPSPSPVKKFEKLADAGYITEGASAAARATSRRSAIGRLTRDNDTPLVQHRSSATDSTYMPLTLAAEFSVSEESSRPVVRGADHSMMFAHLGELWDSELTDPISSEHEFLKAREVDYVDDYLTHDWGSSRWPKFLTLCFLYNGSPALVASFAFLVLVTACRCSKILPDCIFFEYRIVQVDKQEYHVERGVMCTVLVPFVFVFFFFYWDRLRNLVLRPRTVFVDKLCVQQSDCEMKICSVMGLSAYIHRADNMVVLWSPRMFTRLWCTFEVFAWLHLEKPSDKIWFMPTSQPSVVLSGFALNLLDFSASVSWGVWFTSDGFTKHLAAMVTGVTLMVVVVLGVLFAWFIAKEQRALSLIPGQLEEFSLSGAACYCCDVQHADAQIQVCDRKLIMLTLRDWCVKQGLSETTETFQEQSAFCDRLTRHVLRNQLLQIAMDSRRMPFKYMMIACLPFWCEAADSFPTYVNLPNGCWIAASQIAMPLLVYPTLFRIMQAALRRYRFQTAALFVGLPMWAVWKLLDHATKTAYHRTWVVHGMLILLELTVFFLVQCWYDCSPEEDMVPAPSDDRDSQ